MAATRKKTTKPRVADGQLSASPESTGFDERQLAAGSADPGPIPVGDYMEDRKAFLELVPRLSQDLVVCLTEAKRIGADLHAVPDLEGEIGKLKGIDVGIRSLIAQLGALRRLNKQRWEDLKACKKVLDFPDEFAP